MKNIFIIILVLILLAIILGAGCALYNIRDRHPGYELDLRLPEKTASQTEALFQVGMASLPITPEIIDTWVDADSNGRYEPKKGDSFVDNNNNGKFDAYWLAGFHNARPAQGVHDDIFTRAIVLNDGRLRIAIVVLDAIGFMHDDVITTRKMVPAEWEIDQVIICSTHNHEVPDLMGLWGKSMFKSGVNQDYLRFVQTQTVEAISVALKSSRPAYIRLAKVDSVAKDLVRDSRPPQVFDDAIHLMQFIDAETDDNIGVLMNWGNHPETLSDDNLLVTSDFCGYWRDGVEKGIIYDGKTRRAGIGGTTIFINGAVGGLMTTLGCNVYDPWLDASFKKASFKKARAQGFRLANLVLDALSTEGVVENRNPSMGLRAKTINLQVDNTYFKLGAVLGIFDRGFKRLKYLRSEVNLLIIGDAWLVMVPGEIYPEIVNGGIENPPGADYNIEPVEAPAIRQMMRGKFNFVVGLANDEIGYIIPKSEWDHYKNPPYLYNREKPLYGEVNSLGPETAPKIHSALKELIEWID